jgi:tetratricopeptide (TPR) repeat protein
MPAATPPPGVAEKKAPADRAGGQAIQRPTQTGTAPLLTGPPAPRPWSDEEKGKLESVRKLLAENAKAKELQRGYELAQEVAAAHPESMDAQRLAGEAAYRVSRWSDAVSYLQRGGGLPDSEPELLFYLAVSLFESGDRPEAAAILRRSLPNLQRSPYVDAYARKILGQ